MKDETDQNLSKKKKSISSGLNKFMKETDKANKSVLHVLDSVEYLIGKIGKLNILNSEKEVKKVKEKKSKDASEKSATKITHPGSSYFSNGLPQKAANGHNYSSVINAHNIQQDYIKHLQAQKNIYNPYYNSYYTYQNSYTKSVGYSIEPSIYITDFVGKKKEVKKFSTEKELYKTLREIESQFRNWGRPYFLFRNHNYLGKKIYYALSMKGVMVYVSEGSKTLEMRPLSMSAFDYIDSIDTFKSFNRVDKIEYPEEEHGLCSVKEINVWGNFPL